MKIAYIYTALLTVGGADRVITEKANYFAEQCGYDVYIITDSQAGRPPVFPLSPKVHHIDLEVDFSQQYGHNILKRASIYFKLMRIYKKRLTDLLTELQLDITVTTMGRDLDFLTSLKDGSKKVAEAHVAKHFLRNLHLMEERGWLNRMGAKMWRNKMDKAIRKFDAFVVLTDRDAESWKEIKHINVIPNSLPFYPQESSTLENKKAISVGRYNEQKGYNRLISAWEIVSKKHPDWEMNIYGNGELQDQLQQQINEAGIAKQFFLREPTSEIENKYLESSLYIMSSRFEGFGMVLTEAMACGVPCISFDCPHGPSDIIKNNEDGILVENGNIEAMAQAICRLIENEDERKAMGAKAKENIKRYSAEVIMQKWITLFKSLKNS